MTSGADDLISYRLKRAAETLNEVDTHVENGYWNTAVNRLYYACYYAVSALLLKNSISVHTHKGVRQMFGAHYVQTGKISRELGKFFSDICDKRQTADYDDFVVYDKSTVEDLLPRAREFVTAIEKII